MRALLNGVEKNTALSLFKEADGVINVILCSDNGVPVDITGDTVGIDVFATKTRSGAELKTFAGVLGTAAGGSFSATVTPAIMDFGPGTYYLYPHRTDTDGAGQKYFAEGFGTLVVS